ncbi:MAG: enoyl-CoA hydratase/isomerase family protein [Rhizobiaceae bacterium]
MTAAALVGAQVRDRVLHVLIDRAEKRNALSTAVLDGLAQTFHSYAGEGSLVAAVLTGAGDKCFAAGGDLKEFDRLRSEADGRHMALTARSALDAIRSFPVPVIAALNGDALGGGAELAACCDFRLASPHARIGFIQGRLSISTAWGGGIDLMQIIGRQKALRLLSTARIVDAAEALALGFLDGVADGADTLPATVDAFLAPMRELVPQSQRAFKAVARATFDRRAAEDVELANFSACWAHADHWSAHDRILSKSTA